MNCEQCSGGCCLLRCWAGRRGVEDAYRRLITSRLDITGTRRGLDGAEAVGEPLRASRSSRFFRCPMLAGPMLGIYGLSSSERLLFAVFAVMVETCRPVAQSSCAQVPGSGVLVHELASQGLRAGRGMTSAAAGLAAGGIRFDRVSVAYPGRRHTRTRRRVCLRQAPGVLLRGWSGACLSPWYHPDRPRRLLGRLGKEGLHRLPPTPQG